MIVLFAIVANKETTVVSPQYVPVVKIRVISGNEFDITLKDGKRIHGLLGVAVPTGQGNEVSKAVQDLINHSENPRVELLEKDKDNWKVELYLKVKGKDVRLSEWLRQNRMTWE